MIVVLALAAVLTLTGAHPQYAPPAATSHKVSADVEQESVAVGPEASVTGHEKDEYWWKEQGIFKNTGKHPATQLSPEASFTPQQSPLCGQGYDCVPWGHCVNGLIDTTGYGQLDLRKGGTKAPESLGYQDCGAHGNVCCLIPPDLANPHGPGGAGGGVVGGSGSASTISGGAGGGYTSGGVVSGGGVVSDIGGGHGVGSGIGGGIGGDHGGGVGGGYGGGVGGGHGGGDIGGGVGGVHGSGVGDGAGGGIGSGVGGAVTGGDIYVQAALNSASGPPYPSCSAGLLCVAQLECNLYTGFIGPRIPLYEGQPFIQYNHCTTEHVSVGVCCQQDPEKAIGGGGGYGGSGGSVGGGSGGSGGIIGSGGGIGSGGVGSGIIGGVGSGGIGSGGVGSGIIGGVGSGGIGDGGIGSGGVSSGIIGGVGSGGIGSGGVGSGIIGGVGSGGIGDGGIGSGGVSSGIIGGVGSGGIGSGIIGGVGSGGIGSGGVGSGIIGGVGSGGIGSGGVDGGIIGGVGGGGIIGGGYGGSGGIIDGGTGGGSISGGIGGGSIGGSSGVIGGGVGSVIAGGVGGGGGYEGVGGAGSVHSTCSQHEDCVQLLHCKNGIINVDGEGLVDLRKKTDYPLCVNPEYPDLPAVCCRLPDAPPVVAVCPDYSICTDRALCDASGHIVPTSVAGAGYTTGTDCYTDYVVSLNVGVCCKAAVAKAIIACPASSVCIPEDFCFGDIFSSGSSFTPYTPGGSWSQCLLQGISEHGVCCNNPPPDTGPVTQQCGVSHYGTQLDSLKTRIHVPKLDKLEADFGELPWQAIVFFSNYTFKCGASLISDRHLLTVAHCVNGLHPGDIRIRVGEWQVNTFTEPFPYQDLEVASIIVKPDYKPGPHWNNIAIIEMKTSVELQYNVNSVCLPHDGTPFPPGTRCLVSGWGKDSFTGSYQHILKKIEVPLVDHYKCQNLLRHTRLGKYFRLHESYLCAGGEEGIDACVGDGGGPLICYDDAKHSYVQVGITAWGIGCGVKDVPAAYTDVSKFTSWISDVLKQTGNHGSY